MTPHVSESAVAGEKDWQQYEMAVAQFLAAAGPTAKVIHDQRQPDPDTGSSRQRDIWIESVLCGLFPIKSLGTKPVLI